MSRPKSDPVERIVSQYMALTTEQQDQAGRIIRLLRGVLDGAKPAPARKRPAPKPKPASDAPFEPTS